MAGRIVCIGECMVELTPAGEGLYARGFAGDTFNTAWYARRVAPPGIEIAYMTAVGDDALSGEMAAFMRDAGLRTELTAIPGGTVGLYMISLSNGERSFSYWRSASAARRLADDLSDIPGVGPGHVVYTSGITAAILPPEGRVRLLAAVRRAKDRGALFAFDPNLRPRLWQGPAEMRDTITSFAAAADLVFPSFDDEATLFGDADKSATVARYHAAGADTVVLKDGPGDVWLAPRGQDPVPVPAERVGTPIDTTAAGDAFNAAYLVAMLGGAAPEEAARAGCRLSAKVIMAKGALVDVG